MRRAIITGSFDPVTAGHEDLIRRAADMFDAVTVVVLANAEKPSGMFHPTDRLRFVEDTVAGIPNADAAMWPGLTSDIAHALGAKYLIRGARSGSDFDYEYDLAYIMKRFDPELETVILPSRPELSMISSTYVRELLKYGSPLEGSVPDACLDDMRETYAKSKSE